ncbi:MAG: mannitol-/sugar-/sorbitol-6-phosphatase [Subtercola sp.]|nr:mannitol-/sugar-/sorbitol-6-phosphatase [Subtercola sp.]
MAEQSQVGQVNAERKPFVVLMAGVAGSGKTTLGRALAARLGLPILDLDTLTNPLLDALSDVLPGEHWLTGPHAPVIRSGRYAVLREAAAEITALGLSAVLVAPFTAELRGGTEWAELVAAVAPATVVVVHVDGSPALLAARRAERGAARDAFRPADAVGTVTGFGAGSGAEVGDAVPAGATVARGGAPVIPHLRIEAALATEQQLQRVLRELGVREPVDTSSTLLEATFDAVLFDLDGTLLDSTGAVLRSWETLAAEYGFSAQAVQENHGRPAGALIRAVVAPGRVAEAAARIQQLEVEDVDGITPIAGALDLLAALPPGAKAVVTSGTRAIATARMAAAGIPAPDVVITADDVTNPKPDPEPFLRAAALLGVDPARCLVVEDAPAGVTAARAAGCLVLGVGGTTPREALPADLWVDALDRVRIVPRPDGGFGLALAPLR